MDIEPKIILRFAESSDFEGQFVALEDTGYPHAVTDPFKARFWANETEARNYAKSFEGTSSTYARWAIDPTVLHLTAKVEEAQPAKDQRPHSRACGIRKHDHGTDCNANCPTCGGKSLYA